MTCRHCGGDKTHLVLDLGVTPPSNAYVAQDRLERPEAAYPLRIRVCADCWLVQTEDYTSADDIFTSDYAYFSSTSSSWLAHARAYCDQVRERFALNESSLVIEVASNDGYLLKNFVARGIPCLGIEPTASTAAAAEKLGIPVLREFFGVRLARQLAETGRTADLIVGNNVFAHVPDINDFTEALRIALKPGGVITLEFPHLLRMMQQTQFDTVYHEHFSYLSLYALSRIFARAQLKVWDVEELGTHGGSLRVYGCRAEDPRACSPAVAQMLEQEERFGLRKLDTYRDFQARAEQVRRELLAFLTTARANGKRVAAYGAAAKGNTLLNYAGVTPELLSYVCDAAPSKQGKFLPGSHIPILPPEKLYSDRPDFVLVLPWNLMNEIAQQHGGVREWGGRFVIAIPKLTMV